MTAAEVGTEFARRLAAKDFDGDAELLDPQLDFRALTPNRQWEAQDPRGFVDGVLREWFEDSDDIRSLDAVEHGEVADRSRVAYRLTVTNPEGRFLVEQQAYYTVSDGRIDWLRVLCSGYRPWS